MAQSDSFKIQNRKNEFGLSVQPIAAYIMDSKSNTPEIGVSYKRQIFDHYYFRVGSFYSWGNNDGGTTLPWNDSILRFDKQNEKFYSLTQRIGIENRKSIRGKCFLFYGADYIIGFKRNTSSNSSVFREYNEEPAGNNSVSIYRDSLYSTAISKSISLGLGFNLGIMIPVGKRFFTSAEMRCNFNWVNSQYRVNDVQTNTWEEYDKRSLDFNYTRPIYNLTVGLRI
jgi:hypothetical protein